MTRPLDRIAVGAALMVVAGVAAVLSAGLSPRARLVPLGVSLVTLALLAVEIGASLRSGPAGETAEPGAAREPGERAMLAWLAVLIGLVLTAGMPAGLPAYVLLYLRLRGAQSWWFAAGVALALWIVLSWGLQMTLGVRLYRGWLGNWIGTG